MHVLKRQKYNQIYQNKNDHTVGTIPKSFIKIVERGKIHTPKTQIHDRPISWPGTGTSNKKCRGQAIYMGPNLPS